MARQERNRMMLNTVDFKPTVFTPLERKPLDYDMSLLERSFALQDERKSKALEQQTAIDIALSKIEEKLHPDIETQRWFNEYKNNIKKEIQTDINVGNYGGAYNTGVKLAGRVTSDSEVINRLKSNAEYQAKVDEVHKMRVAGQISKDTEDWWLDVNEYKYENIFDESNNIIGGTSYKDLKTPVADIDIPKFTKQAFDLITYRLSEKNKVDKYIEHTATKTITPKQIKDNLEQILKQVPGAADGMRQEYDKLIYKYNKLRTEHANTTDNNKKLEIETEIRNLNIIKNGSCMSFESFCTDRIKNNIIAQNLAFVHEQKSISSNKKYDEQSGGNTGGDSTGNEPMVVEGAEEDHNNPNNKSGTGGKPRGGKKEDENMNFIKEHAK